MCELQYAVQTQRNAYGRKNLLLYILMGSSQHYKYITTRQEEKFKKLLTATKSQRLLSSMDYQVCQISCATGQAALRDAFSCILSHRAKQIATSQGVENILNCMGNTSFPNLISVNLWNASLASVEVLPRIHMPQISQLWIYCNKITTIRALRKGDFPNLTELGMRNNELREFNKLSEANFPGMKLLQVDFYSQAGPQDLSCTIKLSANAITKLKVYRYIRIDQPNIRRSLSAKYSEIMINYCQR